MLQTAGRQGLEQRAYVQHTEALDRLLERTESMLRKGASLEVVALAEETLRALKAEVLPMIEQAHKAQTSLLATHYEAVVNFLSSYSQELEQLSQQQAVEASASSKHRACRLSEDGTVSHRVACADELATLWEQVMELEEDLTNVEERIAEEWCLPGVNLSGHVFRENSVHHFDKYTAKRTKLTYAWKMYTEHVPSCNNFREENNEEDDHCDTLQYELEEASCLSTSLGGRATRMIHDTWPVVSGAFQDTVATVTTAVSSRKHEYSVLKVVACLIEKIREIGGQPCDEQEAGFAAPAPVDYLFMDWGANDPCLGAAEAVSEDQCEVAAVTLNLTWQDTISQADRPKGCIRFDNDDVFFNSHATGGAYANARKICIQPGVMQRLVADEEIHRCHEASENITHLDIAIPKLPPAPSAPEPQLEPCSDAYLARHYSKFPENVVVAECRPCIGSELTWSTSEVAGFSKTTSEELTKSTSQETGLTKTR